MTHITNRTTHIWRLLPMLILICMGFLAHSCQDEPVIVIDSDAKKAFLESEIVGFYYDGDSFMLDKTLHQVSRNSVRRSFGMQTDDQSEYLNVKMESIPKSAGVNVMIHYSFGRGEERISYIQMFECSKISDGYLWFWSKSDKIGIILPWK